MKQTNDEPKSNKGKEVHCSLKDNLKPIETPALRKKKK